MAGKQPPVLHLLFEVVASKPSQSHPLFSWRQGLSTGIHSIPRKPISRGYLAAAPAAAAAFANMLSLFTAVLATDPCFSSYAYAPTTYCPSSSFPQVLVGFCCPPYFVSDKPRRRTVSIPRPKNLFCQLLDGSPRPPPSPMRGSVPPTPTNNYVELLQTLADFEMLFQERHLQGRVFEPVHRVARPEVAVGVAHAEQHGGITGVGSTNPQDPLGRVPHVDPELGHAAAAAAAAAMHGARRRRQKNST